MIPMAVFKARKKEIHAGHGELNFPRLKQMDFLMNEKCYIFYPIGRKPLRQKTSPAGAFVYNQNHTKTGMFTWFSTCFYSKIFINYCQEETAGKKIDCHKNSF